MVIEYHDFGRSRNHVELLEILRANGFEVEAIHATGGILSALLGVRVGMIWAKKRRPLIQPATAEPVLRRIAANLNMSQCRI